MIVVEHKEIYLVYGNEGAYMPVSVLRIQWRLMADSAEHLSSLDFP